MNICEISLADDTVTYSYRAASRAITTKSWRPELPAIGKSANAACGPRHKSKTRIVVENSLGRRFLQRLDAAISGARGKDPIVADAQLASGRIVTERDLNAIFNILSCADHVNEPGSGIHIASGASVALVPAAHARVPLRIRSIEECGWNGWIDRDGAVGLIRRRHNFCQEAGITGKLAVVVEHFYPIISFEAQHTVASKSFEFQDGVRTTGRRNRIHSGDNRSIITRPFELCWIGSAYGSGDMHFNAIEPVLKSTIAARGR